MSRFRLLSTWIWGLSMIVSLIGFSLGVPGWLLVLLYAPALLAPVSMLWWSRQ